MLAHYGDLSTNGDNVQTILAGGWATAFFPGRPLYRTPHGRHPLARLRPAPLSPSIAS